MSSGAAQTIWLGPTATTYAGLCEECLARPRDPRDVLAYRDAKVAGSLRADADVGFGRCRRGHRLRLRRSARAPLAAAGAVAAARRR